MRLFRSPGLWVFLQLPARVKRTRAERIAGESEAGLEEDLAEFDGTQSTDLVGLGPAPYHWEMAQL